jgi:pimeloyl-ACP methyl ester carboxylesterase
MPCLTSWGLGRTEPRSKSAKGIMQWAAVVEEVLDLLHIHQCSVMAHSAGAPYALSFANKLSKRIRGNICLLAPWVGGSEGGKSREIVSCKMGVHSLVL